MNVNETVVVITGADAIAPADVRCASLTVPS